MAHRSSLLLALFLTGAGCDTGPHHAPRSPVPESASARPPAVESLRVASFNVNWGNADLPRAAAAVREADADVVLLQETTPASEAFLIAEFRAHYPHRAVRGHTGRYGAERFAILSRYPLSGVRFVPPEHGLFGCLIARITLGDREIQVANVHLQPFQLAGRGGARDFVARAASVEDIHAREIEAILAALDASLPTLIAGDLNSLSGFNAPTRLEEHGFTDSFAALHANADHHPTWRWPVGRTDVRLRIDYIFHDPGFETRASRTLCDTGSDHCLLVSELRFAAVRR